MSFEVGEHVVATFQASVGEAADYLQQAERALPVRTVGRADHAVVQQGAEAFRRIEAIPPAHRLDRLCRERGREDR